MAWDDVTIRLHEADPRPDDVRTADDAGVAAAAVRVRRLRGPAPGGATEFEGGLTRRLARHLAADAEVMTIPRLVGRGWDGAR